MAPEMTDFRKRLMQLTTDGMVGLSMALGYRLHLFDALIATASKNCPQTAEVIAGYAKLKPRYVREWLCTMACADIINVDDSGERFWIDESIAQDLDSRHPFFALENQQFLPLFGAKMPEIAAVFQLDGPLGMPYDAYENFYKIMNAITTAKHSQFLIPNVLPMIDGILPQLTKGIRALDVGCGNGFHVTHFAEHFPNSNFTGVDLTADAIRHANESRSRNGTVLQNAVFMQMNAQKLNADWTDSFDWVTIHDACHDQTRPDLSLKEIHRVLKPDGVFSMLEIKGTSNVCADKQKDASGSAFFYAVSMFHCLAVGSNEPGALCLGTMWGVQRATELLKAAGFRSVEVKEMDCLPNNLLYICKK